MRQPYVVPRRRLLFAVWLTVLALPILVIDNIPRTEARAAPATVRHDDASAPSSSAVPATDVTASTEVPATPPSTTPEPQPVVLRSLPAKSTTTTTRPPSTSAPTTTAPPNEETGGASWYDYQPGECAHRTLPKGTVVTVTDLANGRSVTCVVTDRGPYDTGRIIDLDRDTFAELADPSAGVIQVRITW